MNRGIARGFKALPRAPHIDPSEGEFRLHSVWAAAWVTLIICVPALLYGLTGGGRADRAVFLGAWTVALVGGIAVFALPWRRIIASRWRELAFLTWTIFDLGLIGIAALGDGGPNSPVTGLLFIPIVFVGASYPTWSVNLVSLLGLCAYLSLGIAYGQPIGRLALVLGGLGAAALMSWWQAQNHERRRRELAQVSVTDPLTGALNRRGLHAAAEAALAAVARSGTPVALIIIDLDNLKAYNDTHGHAAGDALLCWIAERAGGTLRPTDAFARIGGDEFAALLAGADALVATVVGERIRAACAGRAPHCIGIASAPEDGQDFDSLYRAADHALYRAKRQSLRRLRPREQEADALLASGLDQSA